MKRTIRTITALVAVMFVLFALTGCGSTENKMGWRESSGLTLDNYKDALKEAKATGKPIFLEYRCEP